MHIWELLQIAMLINNKQIDCHLPRSANCYDIILFRINLIT